VSFGPTNKPYGGATFVPSEEVSVVISESKTSVPAVRKRVLGTLVVSIFVALIVAMIGRRIFTKER
jgi:hypothetical protein